MRILASEPASWPHASVIPASNEPRKLPHVLSAGDGLQLAPPAMVCVLVPTRNEADNVVPLLDRLEPVLAGMGGEVLFVDDSDDFTGRPDATAPPPGPDSEARIGAKLQCRWGPGCLLGCELSVQLFTRIGGSSRPGTAFPGPQAA
jgi:hypothetical protein